jgi:hypothetical protein
MKKGLGATYDIDFSLQKSSTDTLAVDLENRPFRLPNGRLLFRPGGHGALLENLNDLQGDIVFIKNIDNVVPDHLKGETYHWKKIMAGLSDFHSEPNRPFYERTLGQGGRRRGPGRGGHFSQRRSDDCHAP